MATEEEIARLRRKGELEAEADQRRKDRIKDLEDENSKLAAKNALEDEAIENSERLLEIELNELKIRKLNGETVDLQIAQAEKSLEQDKEQTAGTQSLADAVAGLVGIKKDFNKTMTGSIVAVLGNEKAQKKLAKQLKKSFSIQAMGLSIVTKFAEATMALAYAQDEALASFNKNTGAARLYEQQIMALERTTFQHGVGVGESAEAYSALATNVTDLRNMSRGTQDELSKTTAILGHMGVSMDTTAANVQFMTRSMGVSTAEASKYQRELFTLAQEIGMPPEQMAAGFKAAAPKLAAFGKQAGKVFTKLAKNARAAGMEVEQLLGIVEQFDTFEGAAESVGKLNALLGGPFLNSMEMVMTTDPSERMRMLSGALNDAGKSFDQMTYYEKKSIAAAAGLSDVNELALVMAGSFDESAGGANRSQAEIEALAKQSKEFNTMMEELTQTMMMFALEMRPVIEGIKSFLQWLQGWMPLFRVLTPFVIGLASALTVYGTKIAFATLAQHGFNLAWALGPFGKIMGIIAGIMILSNWVGPKLAVALGLATAAVWALTGGFGALNVATAGIPALIGLIVTGVIMLIQALFGTDVGHSNFLEGIWKIGWGFEDIGTAIGGLISTFFELIPVMFKFLTPFGILMTMWESIMGSSKETEKSMARMSTTKPLARATDAVNRDSLGDATQASKPVTYKSDSPQGISQKSTNGSQSSAPAAKPPVQDHKVVLQFDPRKSGFKEFVIDLVNQELNANQG